MQDRQIVDNIVLVQEAIHTSYRTKSKGMVVKLDMENAFDRVDIPFFFRLWNALDLAKIS
jgi:hypothetical protein